MTLRTVPTPAPPDADEWTTVNFYSVSTSIVPASVPFAPLIACLLFFLPFSDIGQNYSQIITVKDTLKEKYREENNRFFK